MATSAADRQRRSRKHRAGDHSLCVPGRCDAVTVTESVTTDVTATVTPPASGTKAPPLGARGRRLWRQLADDGPPLKPTERVLAEEACRTADRLDTLDRILRGDEDSWMRFRSMNEDGTVVAVQITNVLSEARQQQVALKALLAELRTSRQGPAAKPGVPPRRAGTVTGSPGATGKKGGGVVADLAAWVADRSTPATG
ncbi:hypothetical protein ACH5AJ_36550 [Streptomyces rochei]|uniref:hypothetical protein n=1 Tax=Streptomyces rochei TaxID=1928 RepID=UPI00378FDA0A